MYNNLPQLGPPTRRNRPYRRYPKPITLEGWFSDLVGRALPSGWGTSVEKTIERIEEKPLIPALIAGTLLIPIGGTSLLSRIGSAFYTPGAAVGTTLAEGATGIAYTAPTGLLPTVFGVGIPGAGLVGKAATSIGGLLYTPAIASGTGIGTAPTGLLTSLFGLGVPGAGLVGKVATALAPSLMPKGFAPGTDVTAQPQYPAQAGIIPGVSNTNLAIFGIGGVALLILLSSGKGK